MPFLGEIKISGPHPGEDGVSQVTDAVAAAVEAGWQAPRVTSADDDADPETAEEDGESLLDYRVLGYPGGAIIVVVLEDGDLEQTALAVAALAHHLTTWSPGLLAYSVEKVSISRLDKPYDADNWLPPIADQELAPCWPEAELLDDELRSLAAQYLLALAMRSLWNPVRDNRPRTDAQDVVAGAIDDPWGRELTSALGTLLIGAARLEATADAGARLIVRGAGDPGLAADLLRRARETGREVATDGWTDDKMRGHVLVERFMDDHELGWNKVPPDEPPDQTDRRSEGQLRELLWAGLRALATLASPLAHVTGPWQLLNALGGDEVVSILAESEADRLQAAIDRDRDEIQAAAAAHAAVWLAIRRPELLDTDEGGQLVGEVGQDVSSFHQIAYHALLMAGTGPVQEAIAAQRMPAEARSSMIEFAMALAVTDRYHGGGQPDEYDADPGDAYDDMHRALEAALADGQGQTARIRGVMAAVGLSAALTQTEINPRRGAEGYVSAPRQLVTELLARPAEYAALVLSEESSDDGVIRQRALAMIAQVASVAAGEMAADLPDLTGEDPRMEPAARRRARRWIEDALQVAQEHRDGHDRYPRIDGSPDAQAILEVVATGGEVSAEWPVQRVVVAAAEATASVLRAYSSLDAAEDIFTRR